MKSLTCFNIVIIVCVLFLPRVLYSQMSPEGTGQRPGPGPIFSPMMTPEASSPMPEPQPAPSPSPPSRPYEKESGTMYKQEPDLSRPSEKRLKGKQNKSPEDATKTDTWSAPKSEKNGER